MNYRLTIVMIVLAIAAGVYWYKVERERPTAEEQLKRAKVVIDVEGKDVRALIVERPGAGTRVEVRREGENEPWRVVAPVEAEADQGEVDAQVQALRFLDKEATFKEKDHDPAALGFAPAPRLRATLVMADGKRHAVEFGSEQTKQSVHVRLEGGKEAYVVRKYGLDRLDKDPFELREKRVFPGLDRYHVEKVTVTRAGRTVALKKDGEFWRFDGEGGDHADRRKVEELLDSLLGFQPLKATSFPVERPAQDDLVKVGLAPVAGIIALEAGEKRETLLLGKPVEGKDEVYARAASRTPVATIPKDLLAKAPADPAFWRSRLVFHLATDERVESIEVERAGSAPARLARGSDGSWRYAAPSDVPADRVAVEGLARALLGLEVVEIVKEKAEDLSNFGLDAPLALTIGTAKATAPARTIHLGRPTAREHGYHARRAGRDTVFEVVVPDRERLDALYPAFRDPTLVGRSIADIGRIEIARKEGPRVYARDPATGEWRAAGVDPATHEVAAVELTVLAAELAALRADRILPPPADRAAAGLAEPWLTARIHGTDGRPLAVLALGKVTEKGDFQGYALLPARAAPRAGPALLAPAARALARPSVERTDVAIRKDLVDRLDRDYVAEKKKAEEAPPPEPEKPSEAPK